MRGPRRRRIDEELELHIGMLKDKLIAEGMSPEKAESAARDRFGDPETYAEACAGMDADEEGESFWGSARRALGEFGQGFRSIRRAPLFSAAVIGTLALGLGANTALFSVVRGVLIKPLDLADADRLVVVEEINPTVSDAPEDASVGTLQDWAAGSNTLTDFAAWQLSAATLEDVERPRELTVAAVTPEYFATVRPTILLGRALTPADVGESGVGAQILISERFWQEQFGGSPDVIGQVIRMEGGAFDVVGVMPHDHVTTASTVEVWVPFTPSGDLTNRGTRMYSVVARLAPGATVESASLELAAISERIAEEYPTSARGWSAQVRPYRDAVVGSVRRPLIMAQLGVGALLLIVCMNVANLLLARSTTRTREMAVRSSLGADRGTLLRQLLGEGAVLSATGLIAGLMLAEVMRRGILALQPDVLPRTASVALDGQVILFAAGLALLTGLVCGLVPAMVPGVASPGTALRETRSGDLVRRSLVGVQLAITVVLLTGSGLLIRTFVNLRSIDPGFSTEGRVAAQMGLGGGYFQGTALLDYVIEMTDNLAALPGIESVGTVSTLPMDPVGTNFDLPVRSDLAEGLDAGDLPQADFRVISPGYFRSMGTPLLRGRAPDRTDLADSPPVVWVNETMALEFWGTVDVVGRRLETVAMGPWTWREVVGVVADTRFYGPASDPRPEMYTPLAQTPFSSFSVVVHTTGEPATALAALEAEALRLDPLAPPQRLLPVEELLADSIATERFYSWLLTTFAAMALFLAASGVYGVLAYWVGCRRREIGVRMALGARSDLVIRSVVGRGMGVALIGLGAGILLSVPAARALEGMLHGVRPFDPLTYGAVGGVLLVTALVSCMLPAMRAGRIDPIKALREE